MKWIDRSVRRGGNVKTLKNNRGVAVIYITLFLMVLGILFVALGIDVGWFAYVRTQGQAATDAAALRAAAAIPNYNTAGDTTKVYSMVTALNSDNTVMNEGAMLTGTDVEFCFGDPNGNPTCQPATFPTAAGGVKVTKTYSAPYFFGRLLNGGSNTDITVSSTAWLGGPGGLSPTLPVALCSEQIGYDPVTLECNPEIDTDLTPNNVDNAGWWTPIGISASAQECKSMVDNPDQIPRIELNEDINLNNGEITSCHKEIGKKYADCDEATCALDPEDPARIACTAILPIVDCPDSINQQQPVQGFAAVCITDVISTPASNAVIEADLRCDVTAEGSIGGGPAFGVYANRPVLVK